MGYGPAPGVRKYSAADVESKKHGSLKAKALEEEKKSELDEYGSSFNKNYKGG